MYEALALLDGHASGLRFERFKPRDGAYVARGLVIIALSYLLHIVAEVMEHLAEQS